MPTRSPDHATSVAHRSRRDRGWSVRARRWAAAAVALTGALALAAPSPAHAEGRDDRPFGRGTLLPTFGLGAGGFFSDIASVSFGLGFGYYIVNGLSAGLSFSDTVLIYRSSFKARFPGIEQQLPTNVFDITPTLQYVFFRSRRFSPYVYGGAGPVFFNHGAGTHGQWVAGPGVFLNVAGPLYLNVGVGFSGMFPTGRCQDALTYTPEDPNEPSLLLDLCSFRWGPQLGLVVAFGGSRDRGERRKSKRDREEEYEPVREPARNPMGETGPKRPPPGAVAAEPEEASDVPPTEEPSNDVEAPPSEDVTTPEDAGSEGTEVEPLVPVDDAPPPSDAPTDVAPPPSAGSTDVPPPQ